MGLWSWLQNLWPGREDGTVRQLQREVVLQEERFRRIYDGLRKLATRREGLLNRLRQAQNEDGARLIGQSLASLDEEDESLRSRWAQVETEIATLRSSIATATTTATGAQVRRHQRLLERAERLMRERAMAEDELRQAEDRARMGITAAREAIQKARQGSAARSTDSYVALWRESSKSAASEASSKEPPSRG